MCGKKSYPGILEIEKKVDLILDKFDMQNPDQITLDEFQSLVSKDREILQLLKSFNLIVSDDLREVMETDTDEVECDSDIDAEIMTKRKYERGDVQDRELAHEPGFKAWTKRKCNILPKVLRDARPSKLAEDPWNDHLPNIDLQPQFIQGFRSTDVRNSVKLTPNNEVAFFTGKVAVILDRKTNGERFFQYHTSDISCIASCESLFATGEFAEDPCIHIWDFRTMQKKHTLSGVLKKGISHLCFSNDGKKLAALEVAKNHTIVVYNFSKIVEGRATEFRDVIHAVHKGPQEVSSN